MSIGASASDYWLSVLKEKGKPSQEWAPLIRAIGLDNQGDLTPKRPARLDVEVEDITKINKTK